MYGLPSGRLLKQIPGWTLGEGHISKTYDFKNYYQTMAFVNATAWVSHREDHHPDITVGYMGGEGEQWRAHG